MAGSTRTSQAPTWLMPMLRRLGPLLGFLVLAVAMTWPLATRLSTHVVHAKWHYDSMVNIHVLGSRMHYALGESQSLKSVYDNYFCAPTPYSITNNESHFGLVWLFAPFYLATSDPLLSYNLLLLVCLALSGYCMYLFTKELTDHPLAAGLAGVAYAFCPYIFFELGRIQLVAAQWVPLFALLLHRAARTQSWSALIGVALVFAMQVGSCLYYAMFMVVYAAFVGTIWLLEHKSLTRAFFIRFGVAAVLAGSLVAGMVYPYVRARKDFDLTRSEELTSSYSGRLADLAAVYPLNKALPFLHDKADGPQEPIAFPGFTLLALALIALLAPLGRAIARGHTHERRAILIAAPAFALALMLSVYLSFVTHTFLTGAAITALAVWLVRRYVPAPVLPALVVSHGLFLLLGLVLFLGPVPFEHNGQPVRGLYYYLYQHVLGFDGIRYVSRFTIFNMLALCVLAAIGGAIAMGRHRTRSILVFAVLLFAMLFELRNAPIALAKLPSKKDVSPVYTWLAQHEGPEPIATIPAYPMGFYGARNDYLALFHQRRTIDGKSSWMPPITHAFIQESKRFPRRTATRMLQALGVKYLVLHTGEFRSDRAQRTVDWIAKRTSDYTLRFQAGKDYVYEITRAEDPNIALLKTPPLPQGLLRVPASELTGRASVWPEHASRAFDGNTGTKWTTRRVQLLNDWFELELKTPRMIRAIELTDYREAFEAPMAFVLSARDAGGAYQAVLARPEIQMYEDQVFHPRSFVMRLVFPQPVLTSALRIQLSDSVAGRRFTIHELALWAAQ